MKICGRCQKDKELSEFAIHEKGLQSFCKECNRIYTKEHYRVNKAVYLEKQRRRRSEWSEWWSEYKSLLKCLRCPEDDPVCLEFHHRDPKEKDIELSRAVRDGWSKERILKEAEKCDVVCSNCHKKLHKVLK
jgi:hypothetical protein